MVEAVPDIWFLMVWFVLGHSGQRTSVKCAEATWNYKAGGIVHLKSPALLLLLLIIQMVDECVPLD